MAAKTTPDENTLQTIESHAKQSGVRPTIYAGAVNAAGWSPGKMVTKDEFDKAVKDFLKSGTAERS